MTEGPALGTASTIVKKMPEPTQRVFRMHKFEGLDYQQISRVLECSESALKSLLFRAYETLRGRLAHLA